MQIIKHTKMRVDQATSSIISIQLSILEPLLLNLQNLEMALSPMFSLVQTIFDLVRIPTIIRQKAIEKDEAEVPLVVK